MPQVSQFQKQVLSELGIVSWKLRDIEEQGIESRETAGQKVAEVTQGETPAQHVRPGSVSGLDLVRQQMAKNSQTKTEGLKSKELKPKECKADESKSLVTTSSTSESARKAEATETPAESVQEFKAEVLIWQSPSLPISDLTLSLESLNISYQLMSSDSEPAERFPLLISAEPVENLAVDKSTIISSAGSKKQLWQSLLTLKQTLGEQSLTKANE